YQEWRDLDEFIDYKKYQFHEDDIYVFGRLIELMSGNMNLVEIFSYVGKIPENPERIIQSGRLFEPVTMVNAFSRGRWRLLFDNPHYDKWTDSDYKNICFFLSMGTTLWKGGEEIHITNQQSRELKQSGVSEMIVYGSVDLEVEIRSLLARQGLELNYEQTVEARRNEFPQPRDMDKKLKETISPFRWLSERGKYSLYLDAGQLNDDSFAKNNMLGNGYDWEKIASAFVETHMPACKDKFTFACEADTLSMQSITKKLLKEFALAFHTFILDTSAFEELLNHL
ncbi:MAG: hypothetical protein K2O91_18825, partial [Lachnospiraceae bacterium]|nr:hypothetical protein [Lachnospiraceae bacterium]